MPARRIIASSSARCSQIDRPQLQVAIDATIAEVTLNNNLNYGVQFFLTSHNLGLGGDRFDAQHHRHATADVDATGIASAFLKRALSRASIFWSAPEAQPSVILDALHAVTDVKVLSNPSLVVIDNQAATLQVGDQSPISTGSANVLTTSNTIVNTIDYRDTGIICVWFRASTSTAMSGSTSSRRSAASRTRTAPHADPHRVAAQGQEFDLRRQRPDGVTRGTYQRATERDRSGIPLLDQLPERLATSSPKRPTRVTRTELIIFIRPQIIRDSVDAHLVAEELRSKLQGNENARVGPFTPQLKQP